MLNFEKVEIRNAFEVPIKMIKRQVFSDGESSLMCQTYAILENSEENKVFIEDTLRLQEHYEGSELADFLSDNIEFIKEEGSFDDAEVGQVKFYDEEGNIFDVDIPKEEYHHSTEDDVESRNTLSESEENFMKEKLERQLVQQQLDEQGLSGKLYGVQEPKITKTKAKGRKVLVSAYMLIQAIKAAITEGEEHCIDITLGEGKTLNIDLMTLEALYFDDKTGEESYLDNITFSEE